MAKPGAKPSFDHDGAVWLYGTGAYTYTTLAEHLGVNYNTLKRVIREKAPDLTIKRVVKRYAVDRSEVIRLFSTGAYTYEALAAELGVPMRTVMKIIHKRAPHLKPGCKNNGGHAKPTFDHDEAVRLYAAGGYTYSSLADKYHVSRGAISHMMSNKAPHLMPGHRKPTFDHEEAIRKFSTGDYTYVALAEELEVTVSAIQSLIYTKARHLRPGITTSELHDEIIRKYSTGSYTYPELAAELGVHLGVVSSVIPRKAPEFTHQKLHHSFKIAVSKAKTLHAIDSIKETKHAA